MNKEDRIMKAGFNQAWDDLADAIRTMAMIAAQGGPHDDNQMLVGAAAIALRRAAWRLDFGVIGEEFAKEEIERTTKRHTQEEINKMIKLAVAEAIRNGDETKASILPPSPSINN